MGAAGTREGPGRGQERGRSKRTLILVALAGALVAAFFAALGVWQVERLAWKSDLIARVEARLAAAPVPAPAAPEWAAVSPETDEYRRVSLEGRFLHERETLVQAVTDLGPGFWVLTPLVQDDGETVLINRGFVPGEYRDPASRAETAEPGDVTLTGLLRMDEPGGAFLRENHPAADRWFSRDVQAIGAARGLTNLAPYFVDADRADPGAYPVGGLTVVAFRNHHLVYAVTWFALAAMVGGATVFVFLDDRRRRRGSATRLREAAG